MVLKPLFVAQLAVVDRAAKAFVAEGRDETASDHQHWETMYGPHGDLPDDVGMIDWGPIVDYDYDDC